MDFQPLLDEIAHRLAREAGREGAVASYIPALARVSGSHFGIALAALHLGDMPRARKELQEAMANSTTHEQHALYAAKLRHLKSL